MHTIWLVGTGSISIEYSKVLEALNVHYIAIGRSEESVISFQNKTKHTAIAGGVKKFLATAPAIPDAVIVAVNVRFLAETTILLVDYGIKNILLEKPGVCYAHEISDLIKKTDCYSANVFIAYNRRFYSSIFECERLIDKDGGVTSFHFEFTEWTHTIDKINKPREELNNWLLSNSSHVIDTAFFLCSDPIDFFGFHKGSLDWHPSGSIFTGAGFCKNGALFSYHANWESPGRWAIEILTRKHRFYLKPLETLHIQDMETTEIKPVLIDNTLDIKFKAGFYFQLKSFLEGDFKRFCSIKDQEKRITTIYSKINGHV